VNVPNETRAILLARLPGLIQAAARDFQRLTGVEVVARLADVGPEGRSRSRILPPVHPRCADSRVGVPCPAVRATLRAMGDPVGMPDPARVVHRCPSGLHCASVPVVVGREWLATASIVSGPEIPVERFRLLVGLLAATITLPCQEICLRRLDHRVAALQGRMRRVLGSRRPRQRQPAVPCLQEPEGGSPPPPCRAITDVLHYLHDHFREPGLTLAQVAEAVGMNEKYVSHLFTLEVGERMWTHVLALRVRHAGALLIGTDLPIAAVAHDAGFARAAHFRRSFARLVGVSPSGYRRMFGGRTRSAVGGGRTEAWGSQR